MAHSHETVLQKIIQLYENLFKHNGFGEMRIEMRILKRGQKEIIIHCGKQYRYVLDYPGEPIDWDKLRTAAGAGPGLEEG